MTSGAEEGQDAGCHMVAPLHIHLLQCRQQRPRCRKKPDQLLIGNRCVFPIICLHMKEGQDKYVQPAQTRVQVSQHCWLFAATSSAGASGNGTCSIHPIIPVDRKLVSRPNTGARGCWRPHLQGASHWERMAKPCSSWACCQCIGRNAHLADTLIDQLALAWTRKPAGSAAHTTCPGG